MNGIVIKWVPLFKISAERPRIEWAMEAELSFRHLQGDPFRSGRGHGSVWGSLHCCLYLICLQRTFHAHGIHPHPHFCMCIIANFTYQVITQNRSSFLFPQVFDCLLNLRRQEYAWKCCSTISMQEWYYQHMMLCDFIPAF